MIDGKDASTIPAVETPAYIVASACEKDQPSKTSGITKRHVLYAVSAVLVIAIILVAILVGVYMFTESQKEITKFAFQFKNSKDEVINQEVESDPNDNVVQHHVTREGQDVYIVNDYNRGMKVVKITEDGESGCFVTALNRTADPLLITEPDIVKTNETNGYIRLHDPVVDRSFLTKKARDLCKDVPLNWIVKDCGTHDETGVSGGRGKRACITACGYRVCSCYVRFYYYNGRCYFQYGC